MLVFVIVPARQKTPNPNIHAIPLQLSTPSEQFHAHLLRDGATSLIQLEDLEEVECLCLASDLSCSEHERQLLPVHLPYGLDHLPHASAVPCDFVPKEAVGLASWLVFELCVDELELAGTVGDIRSDPRRGRRQLRDLACDLGIRSSL